MNLQLTLLLAYDVFLVILQNLRPFGVFFSKETVRLVNETITQ